LREFWRPVEGNTLLKNIYSITALPYCANSCACAFPCRAPVATVFSIHPSQRMCLG
jgi:hypothetical protein